MLRIYTENPLKSEGMTVSKRVVLLDVHQIDMLLEIVGKIMDKNADRFQATGDADWKRWDRLADIENILFQAGSSMEDK